MSNKKTYKKVSHRKVFDAVVSVALVVLLALFCVLVVRKLNTGALKASAGYSYGTVCSHSINGGTLLSGRLGCGIETFSLSLKNWEQQGDIAYRAFVPDTGWQSWAQGGDATGVAGKSILGVQIMLTGHLANYYDINYRVELESSGWQDWVSDGALAGTTSEPVVSLEVRITAKPDVRDAAWTLTQYGDDDGRQSEFYTLKNNDDGTLIVIDGGWDANTNQVRSVIELLGGKVDYWFITHYDADHVSAFNNIYADPQDITIGTVYATPLDYDKYCECAAERYWDTPEVYKRFLDQTEGDERIVYLSRDDDFDIAGLNVQVFNSYDQLVVDTGSADVANFGSLMFKITGAEDTFLVCGDVYGALWTQLSGMYGSELEAEFVQLGHHGNNHVPPEEWAVVNAKVAFFDGPAWLTEGEDYSAKALVEWCNASGIATYEYKTAPNSFPFE